MSGIVRPVMLKSESFAGMRVVAADPQPPQVRGIGGSVSTRAEYVTGYSHDFTDANGAWLATAHCSPEVAEVFLAALNVADPRSLAIDTTNARTVSIDQGQGAVPLTPVQRAREASGYDRLTSEERAAEHQRIAAQLARPQLEPGSLADPQDDIPIADVVAAVHEGRDPVQVAIDNAPLSTAPLSEDTRQTLAESRQAAERGEVVDDATMAEAADQARTRTFAERYRVDVEALVDTARRADTAWAVEHGAHWTALPRERHRALVDAVLAALGIEVRG